MITLKVLDSVIDEDLPYNYMEVVGSDDDYSSDNIVKRVGDVINIKIGDSTLIVDAIDGRINIKIDGRKKITIEEGLSDTIEAVIE